MGLVGNAAAPYFSCARLYIAGGNPSLSCPPLSTPQTISSCLQSGGPALSAISSGTSGGSFCFTSNGVGNIDTTIATKVPVNQACDGRIGCSLSVNPSTCAAELTGIADPSNPMQASCSGGNNGNPSVTASASPSTPTTIVSAPGGGTCPITPIAEVSTDSTCGPNNGGKICPPGNCCSVRITTFQFLFLLHLCIFFLRFKI